MRIKVSIDGTTPLLMCKFTDAAQETASGNGVVKATSGDRGTPLEQAAACRYLDENGREIIPNPNILRAIIDGGEYFKSGRTKVTTQKTSLIPACVTLNEIYFPLRHKQPWKVDTRPVRIPATGGRILRHRACFDDWGIDFEIELDTEFMTERLLREIVDAAGKRKGLGDFRPACKGPFGKFVVTSWKQVG